MRQGRGGLAVTLVLLGLVGCGGNSPDPAPLGVPRQVAVLGNTSGLGIAVTTNNAETLTTRPGWLPANWPHIEAVVASGSSTIAHLHLMQGWNGTGYRWYVYNSAGAASGSAGEAWSTDLSGEVARQLSVAGASAAEAQAAGKAIADTAIATPQA